MQVVAVGRRPKRRSTLRVGLLALAMCWSVGPIKCLAEELTAEGIGEVRDGDELAARGAALDDAKHQGAARAVESALGVSVATREAERIESSLIPLVLPGVHLGRVLQERRDGALYRVKVVITYNPDEVRAAALRAGLMKKEGRSYKPRIVVVLPEHHLTQSIPDPAAETAIVSGFVRQHFYVVDQSQVSRIRYNDQASAASRGDVAAAKAIGRQFNAEVVICGEAFSERVPAGGASAVSCRARVEVRAIKTDTGQILAAEASHQSAMEATEALASKAAFKRAGDELADKLILEILSWEDADVEQGRRITLYIPRINYDRLERIKGLLGKEPQVVEFLQRSFAEGIAEIEVVFKGGSQELADVVQGFKIPGGYLRVKNYTENRIDVSLINYESDDPRFGR